MFSWKVWMTFVIVCISCVESRHSNSCISSTAIQPGLLVAGWSRSWSHGFNPDIKDLFLFRALLFTSRSCKGFLFPLLANAWLFGSLTLSGFDYLHLLNPASEILLFFQYFLIFCLQRSVLLTSQLIIPSPSCHVFLHISVPSLCFGSHISHSFIIVCSCTLI